MADGESASFVKRSDMDFSCRRGGSMMWTSGWGHWGSWIAATAAAARTMTGMSCVIVVSRSWGRKAGGCGSLKEFESLAGKTASSLGGLRVVVVIEVGGRVEVGLFVIIVRERRGMLSFFVRRMEAEEAARAERRARWRGASGMRRFTVLFSTAD